MFSSLDTKIAFFGGSCNIAALEAAVRFVNAGFEVVAGAHDPREGVILEDAGIPFILSRMEATTGTKVILTSCAHPSEVEELYLGDDGLLEVAEPGTFLIDLSVITPRLAQEIQAMAAVNDLTYLDAPVLNVGEQEESVCFLGGEKESVDMVAPLMPYLANIVRPLSSPGEGALSAVMVIIGLAGSLMGTIEAMAMARICGFDTRSALDALASTGAATRTLIDYIPKVLEDNYTGRNSVQSFLDMLDTALMASEDMDVTLPSTETAYQLYDLLSVVGGDEMNIQAISLLYEDEQTCADFGLDWALADQIRDQQAISQMSYSMDDGYDDVDPAAVDPNADLRDIYSSLRAQLGATGVLGTGDPDLDDYRNHHHRPDDDDSNFPMAGEFFSKN